MSQGDGLEQIKRGAQEILVESELMERLQGGRPLWQAPACAPSPP